MQKSLLTALNRLPRSVIFRNFARQRQRTTLPLTKREKRLDVVIFGLPNVGKSVLLNCLIEHKVAAVTHKRHTTRGEILGFAKHRNTQLAFYDTPGYVTFENAQSNSMKALRNVGLAATSKADVILLCVDASRTYLSGKQQDWFADMAKVALENAKQEVILVLNKVDLVEPKELLLDLTYQLVSLINGVKYGSLQAALTTDGADADTDTDGDSFPHVGALYSELDTTTFMVSAIENDGVIDLKNYLLSVAKHKPFLVPERLTQSERGNGSVDNSFKVTNNNNNKKFSSSSSSSSSKYDDNNFSQFTNQSSEQIVEEIILQSMLQNTHEEIPYIANITCKSIRQVHQSTNMNMNTNANKTKTGTSSVGSGSSGSRLHIECEIEVDTTKQQRIVVGHNARTLVKIRQSACEILEKVFEMDLIILKLNVTTRFNAKGIMKKNLNEKNDFDDKNDEDENGDDDNDDDDDRNDEDVEFLEKYR